MHRQHVLPKGFNVAGSLSNLTVFPVESRL